MNIFVCHRRGFDQTPSLNHSSKQSIASEGVPKSVARVLNAARVQKEWRENKRKYESGKEIGQHEGKGKKRRIDGSGSGLAQGNGQSVAKTHGQPDTKNKTLSLQPGESLGHFNRRVEGDMQPLIKSAMQSSLAQARKVGKSELGAKFKSKSKNAVSAVVDKKDNPSPSPSPISKHEGRPTEFQKSSTSAPRRLNDVAQAPPELKKLSRGVKEYPTGKSKATSGREDILSMKQKLMMREEREKAILRYRALKERRRMEGEGGCERGGGGDHDE